MAALYIDIEEVELTRAQGEALVENVKALVIAEYPDVDVTMNGDSTFDDDGKEPADEDDAG